MIIFGRSGIRHFINFIERIPAWMTKYLPHREPQKRRKTSVGDFRNCSITQTNCLTFKKKNSSNCKNKHIQHISLLSSCFQVRVITRVVLWTSSMVRLLCQNPNMQLCQKYYNKLTTISYLLVKIKVRFLLQISYLLVKVKVLWTHLKRFE